MNREQLRHWYNGYSWTGGSTRLYNPFSLLSALNSGEVQNYWIETGTPAFLAKFLVEKNFIEPEAEEISQVRLVSFDPLNLDPIGLLFQTGYLTVTGRDDLDPQIYFLDYPNSEVRQSLRTLLLRNVTTEDNFDTRARANRMTKALLADDVDKFFEHLNGLYAGVPYDLWNRDGEFVFHTVFYLALELVGVPVQVEVHTKLGRADAVVQLPDAIYVFEFKYDQSANSALKQIAKNGYLDTYADDARRKIAVGARFSSAKRRVADWPMEAGE